MGPPVSAAFKPDGEPTPAAAGFARKNGVEVADLERQETPKGVYLAFRKKVRGKAAIDVLPDVLGARAARPRVPEADALGRDARRRARRAAVRPPDPLDSLPLRRARRAVRHRPPRGRAVRRRAGRAVRRGDLRPPLPGDVAAARAAPSRCGRSTSTRPSSPRASCCSIARSATPRLPASSTRTRAGSAAASAAPPRASRACCRRCRTWSSTRRSWPAPSRPSSSSCPRKC